MQAAGKTDTHSLLWVLHVRCKPSGFAAKWLDLKLELLDAFEDQVPSQDTIYASKQWAKLLSHDMQHGVAKIHSY